MLDHGGDGGVTMDGYDEDGNSGNDTDNELAIFIFIKVLEVWLCLSLVFFIVATLRFYVALYQLGMRTDGFQPTLQTFRRWIVYKWLHGKVNVSIVS